MPEIKHKVFGTVGSSSMPKEPELYERNMSMDDLQSLIELGCIRDKIEIGDKVFCMRSLNATERLELSKFLGNEPDTSKLFEFNIKLLAIAVESINDIPFEDFHTDKKLNPIKRKQELLSIMQSPVLGRLLEHYNSIIERCDAQFKVEEVKN